MADYTGKVTAFNGHPLYEGRPIGAVNDPVGTVGDVVFNAGYDLLDMGSGIKTLGSGIAARSFEMVPTPANNWQFKPPIRPEDVGTAFDMGGAIVGNYAHAYVDPVMQGRPLDIGKHFMAHPVQSILDVNALGQAAGISKAVANSAALQSAKASATAFKDKMLGKIGQTLEEGAAAGTVKQGVVDAVDSIVPMTETGKAAAKVVQPFKDAVLAEDVQFTDDLGKYWNKIPHNLRDQVQAYAEGWHPKLMAGGKIPPTIQDYLNRAEDYSAIMRGRISKWADPKDLELEKFQPAAIQLTGMSTNEWKALSRAEQLGVLEQTKNYLDSRKIAPQYSPHVLPGEASSVLRDPTRMQQMAMKSALEQDPSKAGFMRTKQTAGDKAIKSHYDSLRTRWIQISQFQQAYDKVLDAALKLAADMDVLKNAPSAAATQAGKTIAEMMAEQGYVPIASEKLAEAVLGPLKGAVLTEEELAKLVKALMPGDVYLPKEMVKALEAATKQTKYTNNPILKFYDKAVSFSKRYQLGGNLTYGPAQFLQGMGMLEYVSLNGPRSTITSILSYYLAANSKVRAAVPLSIAEDVLGQTISSQKYSSAAVEALFNAPVINNTPSFIQAPLKGMVAAYEKYVDFNIRMGMLGDSFLRAKAGIHHALMMAQEKTPLGAAIGNMLDTSKSVALIEKTFLDDAAKMNVARQVNDALGDFRGISSTAGAKMLGRVTPYPAWLIFIHKYTMKLPVNHPYKTLLMGNVTSLAEKYIADPNAPSYLKEQVRTYVLSPNGNPQVVSKEGMNPLTSVIDLAELLQSITTGQGGESAISMLTAPLQLAFMATTRLSPSTLDPIKDSNLVSDGGKQYTKDDIRNNRIKKGIAQDVKPLPDMLTLSGRVFYSVLARQVETAAEKLYSGGQRSQASTLFHSAPKVDRHTGKVKKAPDWITLMIYQLINLQPVEYARNAKAKEKQANNQLQLRLNKALRKQEAAR